MQLLIKKFPTIHNHFSALFSEVDVALTPTISKENEALSAIRRTLITLQHLNALKADDGTIPISDGTRDILNALECNLATQVKLLPSDIVTLGCCHGNIYVRRIFAQLQCTFNRSDAYLLLNDPSPFVRTDFWDNPSFIPTADDFKIGLLSADSYVQIACIRRLCSYPELPVNLTQRESDLLAFDYTFDYDKDRIAEFVSLPQAILDDRRISHLLSDDLTLIRKGVASNPIAVFSLEHIATGVNDYCTNIQLIFANKMIDSGFIATPEQIQKGISSSDESLSSSWLRYSNWLEAKKLKDYINITSSPKALVAL